MHGASRGQERAVAEVSDVEGKEVNAKENLKMSYENAGLAACEPTSQMIRRNSITERLEMEEKRLNERLLEVSTALAALRKNPEMQAIIDIIAKTL